METVEVKLLQYTFRFRQMTWREESAIKFVKGDNRLRVILSHALAEVSGLPIKSQEEAMKVLFAIPATVIQRVFVIYKGSGANPRRFATVGLYRAPEPGNLIKRMEAVEAQRDAILDKVEAEMEQKFGKQELAEAREIERQMLKNSKMRGATAPTPDDPRFKTTQPVGKKNAN